MVEWMGRRIKNHNEEGKRRRRLDKADQKNIAEELENHTQRAASRSLEHLQQPSGT